MRTAQDYGLPEGNTQTSTYDGKRVHHKDGSVETVSDEYQLNPETDTAVRRHKGIDYSSNDASGQRGPLDFSTPVGGTVTYDPNDARNTVNGCDRSLSKRVTVALVPNPSATTESIERYNPLVRTSRS